MLNKTDEVINETLKECQQESDEHLKEMEKEASPIDEQQPRRSQRIWRVPDWYQPAVALFSAAPAEPKSWYQVMEGVDAQQWSHATHSKYISLLVT